MYTQSRWSMNIYSIFFIHAVLLFILNSPLSLFLSHSLLDEWKFLHGWMDEYVYKIDFCVTYTNSHRHTNVRVSHCTWTHTHTYTVAHMQSTYIRIQHMIFHYCHYYCYYFCHIARCLSLHLHFRFDFTTFVCVYVCVFFFFKYEQKVYRNWANVNKVELFYYDDEKKSILFGLP